MAGGEGSRLRPLTCDIPKPMARLCGRPILEYILDLLENHGISTAAITMRYLPDRITEHFPNAHYKSLDLSFVEEDKPLGTAGSVKNACTPDDDEIIVISGDAMCDFNLADAVAFHRAAGADATILAKKVDDPREYGLIDIDENNSINAFIEKPAFSQAISDLANTGIYILSRQALELIPDNESFDFAKDLFPLMLHKDMKLMCCVNDGYWCDIGDLGSYIQCQKDMLLGRVNCDIYGSRDGAGNIFAGTQPPKGCVITPPVYIGRDVRIEDGALIQECSVVDDGCYVGRNARVTGSILLQNSYIAQRATLTGSLVCGAGTVKAGAMLFECATVGAGAVIGEKATINAGVKVWNKKVIPSSVNVTEHVKTGTGAREYFDDEGITGQIGVELTPEFCARIGSAVGSLNPNARVAVGYSNHRSAEVLGAAVCSGIQSTGAGVMDFGGNFQAQFEFSMNFCSVPIGIYIKGGNRASLRVMSGGGLPASREIERNIEGILSRGEFARCGFDQMGDKVDMFGMGMLYTSQLIRWAPKGLSGCSGQVHSNNLIVQNTLKETLYKLGCDTSTGFRIEVSSQGDKVRIYDPELGYIPHHKIMAWCALDELEKDDIAIPFDAPQVLDDYAREMGRKILRYYNCPADQSDLEARKLAKHQMWSRDALMQAVMLQSIIKHHGGLGALMKKYPSFDMEVRTLDTSINPAGLIRSINSQKSGQITEGVLLRGDKGIVLVKPLKRGTGIRIMAEAMSSETAAELCDDIEKLINNAGNVN